MAFSSMFIPDRAVYVLAVLALVVEIVAWILRRQGDALHALANRAKRHNMIRDAFGVEPSMLEAVDMIGALHPKKAAIQLESDSYYASQQPLGVLRLRDHIQESAFWTRHLYRTAARWTALALLVPIGIAGAAFFALLPSLDDDTTVLLARAFLILMTFIFAGDLADRALDWWSAAEEVAAIDSGLDGGRATDMHDVIAVFADYNTITALTPPVPDAIYTRRQDHLNDLWSQRTAST